MSVSRQQKQARERIGRRNTAVVGKYEQVYKRTAGKRKRVEDLVGKTVDVASTAEYQDLKDVLRRELGITANQIANLLEDVTGAATDRALVNVAERLAAIGLHAPTTQPRVNTFRVNAAAESIRQNVPAAVDNLTVIFKEPDVTPAQIEVLTRKQLRAEGMRAATALTTEEARTFRATATEMYTEAEIGWTWRAELSGSTCAYCWGMHGQEFGPNEEMATHPNCVCAQVPTTPQGLISGETRFDDLTASKQNAVLGPVAATAYRNGEIRLTDLTQQWVHPIWGPVGGKRSLTQVLGPARAQELRDSVLFGR